MNRKPAVPVWLALYATALVAVGLILLAVYK